jgi:hypothetical protein
MLIGLFKNNNSGNYIILSALGLILWLNGFISPQFIEAKHPMPLYELLILPVLKYPYLSTSIGFLLMLLSGFLLNQITNKNETLSKPGFIVALLYIVLMSADNSMHTLHPALIANVLLIFSFYSFTESYRKDSAFSNVFDVGALFSIATLFYAPFILLFPVLAIGLFAFRPFNWREWTICLIGISVPYLFTWAVYFWNDQITYFISDKIMFDYPAKRIISYSSSFYSIVGILLFVLILSLGNLIKNLSGVSQKKIKSIQFLVWVAVFSAISVNKAEFIDYRSFSLFIIPATAFSGEYFLTAKKTWWSEFLFGLLFASLIINLISTYF